MVGRVALMLGLTVGLLVLIGTRGWADAQAPETFTLRSEATFAIPTPTSLIKPATLPTAAPS